jgi:hypothetical protein
MTRVGTRPAGARLVAEALADAVTLGEYFRIATGPDDGPWRPAALAWPDGPPDLAGHTASELGIDRDRVAISIAQLGYAARLWSASLACALRHGVVPDLRGLRIHTELPVRLRLPAPSGWQAAEPVALAELLYRTVVEEQLEPVAASLEAKVAGGLLRGNAASAMIGALGVIVSASPELAGSARNLASALLGTGWLHGAGRLTGYGLDFLRRSCCLYYRVRPGALCGDCPLPQAPVA